MLPQVKERRVSHKWARLTARPAVGFGLEYLEGPGPGGRWSHTLATPILSTVARAICRAKDAGSSKQQTAKRKSWQYIPAECKTQGAFSVGRWMGCGSEVTFHVSQKLNSWQTGDRTSSQWSKNRP
ncbi:hypothetical protein AKAW_06179 [Aspergillus luchuensis IFO 4308]|nr:hypothetical protein AKAW_06179 [Aspergillus luchuensis IFO 4308]